MNDELNERQKDAMRLLRMRDKVRDLYEGAHPNNSKIGSGHYFVTYTGGTGPVLTKDDVMNLFQRRLIRYKWPDRPCEYYTLNERGDP